MTFTDAVEKFLTAKATRHSQGTHDWYTYQFGVFRAWLDHRQHADTIQIDADEIDLFLAHQRTKVSPSTLHGRWRALKALYLWLVARRKIAPDANPIPLIEEPDVPEHEPRHAALDEFLTLLDSVPMITWVDARDRLALTTFFLTGLRISELINLRIGDYDITKRVIRVARQKGGDANVVPMLQSVCDAFVEYIYNRPEHPDDHVFLACQGGGNGIDGVLTRSGMYQRIRTLCQRAGIKRINPHAFRHGLAMHLLNSAGANTALIQRMLRHKDERTTRQIYARWDITGVAAQFDEKMSDVDTLLRGRKPAVKRNSIS